MDRKFKIKSIIGYTLIIVGSTAAACVILFKTLGYSFFLNPEIEFEENQTINKSDVKSDSISIPGFEAWTIDEGEKIVTTNFYNPEKNTCYFVISVVLNDTNEKIYESKYLKPGQHLYEVELLKTLEAGKYNATIHYETYSISDQTPLNGANVPFELVVK